MVKRIHRRAFGPCSALREYRMSRIVSPFMKEVVRLLEARDVIVCVYTSKLDRLVIDSPEIDDRARWGSETRSFGLPLEVLEGRVVATFHNVVEAAIGNSASRETLDGLPQSGGFRAVDARLRSRGYAPNLGAVSSDDSGHLAVTLATMEYIRRMKTPEDAVEEVVWALRHAREFWPDLSWVNP